MRLSPEQIRIIVETVQGRGVLALAASNAGMRMSQLRKAMEDDEDLAMEIEDAQALFRDALTLEVLDRAITGKSDAMLKLAAESMNPTIFKAPPIAKSDGKPTGLTLRTFSEEGEEPSKKEPLQIGMRVL